MQLDMEEDSSVGHMEEEAMKRRQKIQELRAKRKLPGGESESVEPIIREKVELPK